MNSTPVTDQLAEHFFRHSYAKMVAILVRYFGLEQVEVAEDIVQDALVEAMEKWSIQGIPDNPEGWLMDVARKKTINLLKRKQLFKNKIAPQLPFSISHTDADLKDSTLRMIFACCHPELPVESQIALALKTLCGLSIPEIARSLLTSEENINKRLFRAKKKFREGSIKFQIPNDDAFNQMETVFQVLYLLFNEGYFSVHHTQKIRLDMCYEAIRILREIVEAYPKSAKANALMAIMLLSAARFESRINPLGELILFEAQDRKLWDRGLIAQAMKHLSKSIEENKVNSYQIQAGILAEHCMANNFESTNWAHIYNLYCLLEKLEPSSILVTFNKALAQFYLNPSEKSISNLMMLEKNEFLSGNLHFHLALGTLLKKRGSLEKAKHHFESALKLSNSDYEKKIIHSRMD